MTDIIHFFFSSYQNIKMKAITFSLILVLFCVFLETSADCPICNGAAFGRLCSCPDGYIKISLGGLKRCCQKSANICPECPDRTGVDCNCNPGYSKESIGFGKDCCRKL